jgi:predicted acyltransferase
MNTSFKIRSAAIVLIAAGYGWAGGHYIPSNSNMFAYLFQCIILGVLLLLAIKFFSLAETERYKRNWATNGLSFFSVLFLLINILNIVHGFFNTDIHSFGSHNTLADLVPIAIILTGSALWITTILPFKRTT